MLTLLAVSPAFAAKSMSAEEIGDTFFNSLERQAIERYYRERHSGSLPSETTDRDSDYGKGNKGKKGKKGKGGKSNGLPPGLAKRDQLPPGLAKRDRLPPGLDREPLPRELERQLPPRKKGQERVMVDNTVLLIEAASGVVLDILWDAAEGR
ncbi:MAG: hypothetical protein GY696_29940 [Gammaproteobacteria bacterium]|nr:hypothetical protein [Gammaproteobacteria bacterium]